MNNAQERYQTLKEDMDFACMDVTDSDSGDSSTSDISNDAMQ